MLKIISAFLVLVSTNLVIADCQFDEGRYIPAGGSEHLTTLIFSSDSSIIFEHEQWSPGSYDNKEIQKDVGTWSCSGVDISVLLGDEKYLAKLQPIGGNPLGIDEKALALYFSNTEKKVASIIDGEVFYKECLLE